MPTDPPPDRLITEYLKDEARVLNAHIPRKRKSLSELLEEEHPHVICNDGNAHYFRKKELETLSQMVNDDERRSLLLPIIMEITADRAEIIIRAKGEAEAKIFSTILGMSVICKQNKITIYRPQLGVIRNALKTTTQYVFFA